MPEVRLNHSIPTTRFTTNNANSLSSSHSSSVDSPNEENDDSTVSCLICIDSIQRSQPIWTCQQCKCLFHLPCIQTWVREGIAAQKASSVSLPSLHESLSISTHSSSSSSSSKAKPASYLWNW